MTARTGTVKVGPAGELDSSELARAARERPLSARNGRSSPLELIQRVFDHLSQLFIGRGRRLASSADQVAAGRKPGCELIDNCSESPPGSITDDRAADRPADGICDPGRRPGLTRGPRYCERPPPHPPARSTQRGPLLLAT
jgi:hypothetical protein